MTNRQTSSNCGSDNCHYRVLYEGTQRSLADMTTRQGRAFTRLGLFRKRIILATRRAWPQLVKISERETGVRFDDLADEALLAQLEAFISHSSLDRIDLSSLRAAISEAGFVISESELPDVWAADIRRQTLTTPSTRNLERSPVTVSPVPPAEEYSDLMDMFDDDPSPNPPRVQVMSVPTPQDTHDDEPPDFDDFSDLFPDEPAEPLGLDLDDLFGDGDLPPAEDEPPDQPLPPAGGPHRPYQGPTAMRPQSLPTLTTPAAKRQAKPAAPTTPPVAIDPEVRTAFISAVTPLAPVFATDLIGSGDSAAYTAWHSEQHRRNSDVRFVAAKRRHRSLGDLILVRSTANLTPDEQRSWWPQSMATFRGGRLYELGVFFAKYGPMVVSHQVDANIVVVRAALPSGLTGIALVVGTDLGEGGETAARLVDVVGDLTSERLVRVAVLCVNAEAVAPTADLLVAAAATNGWAPPMPVTISRSWEFVLGTGTAIPILGT